jgi:acyl-CoA thioester hydrolase
MVKPFKHKTPIQIRFKDVDKMGHVNNANHLTYIELARIKYFEEVVGVDGNWSSLQGLILAHISIDYKRPIFLHDTVFVYTRCSKLGRKSIELTWLLVSNNGSTEETLAQGIAVLVCYDYTKNQPIEIPTEQRMKIEAYEQV